MLVIVSRFILFIKGTAIHDGYCVYDVIVPLVL